jgi:hypothetical protein
MNTIGDCCEGGQLPQPKTPIKIPMYNDMYGNIKSVPTKPESKPVMKMSKAARKGR